jgi:hypothetical protein
VSIGCGASSQIMRPEAIAVCVASVNPGAAGRSIRLLG